MTVVLGGGYGQCSHLVAEGSPPPGISPVQTSGPWLRQAPGERGLFKWQYANMQYLLLSAPLPLVSSQYKRPGSGSGWLPGEISEGRGVEISKYAEMDLVFITFEKSRYQNTARSRESWRIGVEICAYLHISTLLPSGIFPVQTPWPWLRLAPWRDTGGDGSRNKQISRNGPSFQNF